MYDTITQCQRCGKFFIGKTKRATLCEQCFSTRNNAEFRNPNWCPATHKPKKHEFIAVDGEGYEINGIHEYVLLSIGEDHRIWNGGVKDPCQVFEYLWEQYKLHPNAVFVGFYLTYDWTHWLRDLPRERASMLCSPQLRSSKFPIPFPTEYKDWQFDVLWHKRFRLRKKGFKGPYMYINDVGSFFQMSLVKVLAKRSKESTITQEEIDTIIEGKSKRAIATLDDDMIRYNRTENVVLAKLMSELDESLLSLNVPLTKTQFHGPGQAAQKWIKNQPGNKCSRNGVMKKMSSKHFDIVRNTYYGGCFEVTAHGIIPGETYEYDINSAYPTIIRNLPCMCGDWVGGKHDGLFTVVLARVEGSNPFFGPLPYRAANGNISRPQNVYGWYWLHEIMAARNAGLVADFTVEKQLTYYPCNHKKPYRSIEDLYETRLNVGKESSQGKVCKLIYNSVYGKFAQSVGAPKVSNAVYASLITAGCRCQILDAIAKHPFGCSDVLMVATDAVFFKHKDENLKLSNRLGDWDETTLSNMTIFKPGFYWDDSVRSGLSNAVVKTRGVSPRDFSEHIAAVDKKFQSWLDSGKRSIEFTGTDDWPSARVKIGFFEYSVPHALHMAGNDDSKYYDLMHYTKERTLLQSSSPETKRVPHSIRLSPEGYYVSAIYKGDLHTISTPYSHTFGRVLEYDDNDMIGVTGEPYQLSILDMLGLN